MNRPEVEAGDDVSTIIAKFAAELKEPARPFTLLVRFRVNEGEHSEIEAAFAEARSATLQEAGCILFELNRHASNATSFVVYEQWKSLAAFEAHLRRPYTTKLRDEFNALITGLPEFQVLLPTQDQSRLSPAA